MPTAMDTEDAIISACAGSNSLWEDPHFPPPAGETWLRPSQIYGADATLFAADGMPPDNLCLTPGATGDGWLIGALATLAPRHAQLAHRVPPSNTRACAHFLGGRPLFSPA